VAISNLVTTAPKAQKAPETSSGDPLVDALNRSNAHLERMLFFRRQYDQRRAFFYRQYVGQQDRKTFPDNVTPRSNTFVPYPQQTVEQITARLSDAFFSFEQWFEVKGRGAQDDEAAEKMQLVLDYKLRKAGLIQAVHDHVRNILIYGHAGLKVDWDWDFDIVVDPQPIIAQQPVVQPGPDGKPVVVQDPQTGQPVMQPVLDEFGAPVVLGFRPQQRAVPRMRPRFTAIDIYDLLVDPDGRQVAHVVEKSWGQLRREYQASLEAAQADPSGTIQPIYFPDGMAKLEAALAGETNPDDIIFRIAELWDADTNTVTIQTFGNDREAISWKDLRYSFRQANYSGFKRRWYGGQPILLYHGENHFMHKRCPILHTSYIKLPNEVFGLGVIEIISDLTESFNRFVNMIADNWNLGINRRYAYNTEVDIDHAALNMFNVPGGKVGVSGDPNTAIMPLPTFTPQRGDYEILSIYKGMIEATTGVSDFYAKGVGTPEGNRTATGIASIVNESNFRFKLFIRNYEVDILQPLLEMCASMIQQYMTNPEEVRITDAPVGIQKWPVIKPEELIGNFDFDLVAANYATNKVVRQRNLLAFANWASQTPFWNVGNGIREIGKVFEIRNLNRLIKSDEQVAQEQQAQMVQQVQLMVLQAMLQHGSDMEMARFKASLKPPTAGASKPKTGRPRSPHQPEGKLPGTQGSGLGLMREIGQMLGLGGMGLAGTGEE
jgi:hypothetical protein